MYTIGGTKIRNLTSTAALTAVVMLALLLLSTLVFEPLKSMEFLYYKDRSGLHVSDFVLFFVSGQMVLSGDGMHAYEPEVQRRYIDALISPNKLDKVFFLQYPPITFAVMTPFALLPLKLSYLTWVIFLMVVAAFAVIVYLTRCKGWGPLKVATFTAYLFCAYPAVSAFKHGQPTWLMVAFLLFYLLGWDKQRSVWQGLAIAASSFKPQYGIILGVHALCTRRWRAIAWAAVGTAVILLIGILTVGLDNVIHYPHILHDAETSSSYAGVFPEFMISIRAVLGRYLTPAQALDGSSLLWMLAVVVDCLLFLGAQSRSLGCRQWAFAVAICAGLVFSPHAHVHDLLLLSAALAVTRPADSAKDSSAAAVFLERLWVTLLALYVPLSWLMHSAYMIERFQKLPFFMADCLILSVAVVMLIVQWHAGDTKYDAQGEVRGAQSPPSS